MPQALKLTVAALACTRALKALGCDLFGEVGLIALDDLDWYPLVGNGITALAQDAGDLAAAGVYILEAGMTTDQVANLWSPYLTMAEGLKLTAQTFTTDITKLSCCAA